MNKGKKRKQALHTEKNYLLAHFIFVRGVEGDRATSPFCASRNGSIDAARLSLEVQMERDIMQLEGEVGHFAHRKKTTCLQIFTFVHGAEGDRATSPSSASRNGSIDASRLSLEAQMEYNFMQLEGEVGHFAHGKKTICLRFLFLFMAWRAIRQPRPLLQVETARLMLPERRWKCKGNVTSCSWQATLGTLPTVKIPACNSFLCSWPRGGRGNVALFCSWKGSNWCF